MATIYKSKKAEHKTNKKDSNSDEEMSEVEYTAATATKSVDKRINKQRVLILSSRGINSRQRHLLNDLQALLPHAKKDAKLDAKSKLDVLNELADLNNCNNCIFFEVRKRQDLYMWLSKTPNGPSVKFHIQNIHTMDELKMTGNCLKGSRHILSFDKTFDSEPKWQLIKELYIQIFGIPRGSRKSKPFIDHILTFSIVDGRVWFRNYQIVEKDRVLDASKNPKERGEISLVEIGPRFVMNVIRIFNGSFEGTTVYENRQFVSPNVVRAAHRRAKAARYVSRVASIAERKEKMREIKGKESELSTRKVFG